MLSSVLKGILRSKFYLVVVMHSLASISSSTTDKVKLVKSGDVQKADALVLVFIPPCDTPSYPQLVGGERSC